MKTDFLYPNYSHNSQTICLGEPENEEKENF